MAKPFKSQSQVNLDQENQLPFQIHHHEQATPNAYTNQSYDSNLQLQLDFQNRQMIMRDTTNSCRSKVIDQLSRYSPHSNQSSHMNKQSVNRSKSFIGLGEKQQEQLSQHYGMLLNHHNEDVISRSMDQSAHKRLRQQSPTALIQSCLTFNGDTIDEDMNFLTMAMQPDKIFDLPMALIKVQKAFQNSNQNVLKLKESLELVLQREQRLQEKYDALRKDYHKLKLSHEEEMVQMKHSFKDQLVGITQSVQSLQQQVQEKDQMIGKLKAHVNQAQQVSQELKTQLERRKEKANLAETQKEQLSAQLGKKQRDFEELRQRIDSLSGQEEQSSKQIEQLQKHFQKEQQHLKAQLEEKSLLLQVAQKELDCAKEEIKIVREEEDKRAQELFKIKSTFRDEVQQKYLELLEYKRKKDKDYEELKQQVNAKNATITDLEKKYQKAKEDQVQLEEQLVVIRRDISKINESNRETLIKQRDGFELRMKEMEEEVTRVSLNRYKNELEQKQKFLKMSKKYDEQIRDLRQCLGYICERMLIQDVPEFLKDDLPSSLSELRLENKDLMRMLNGFEQQRRVMSVYKGHHEQKQFDYEKMQLEYEKLLKAYKNELQMRRGLHNQLQELKGNIRVMCRVRPLLEHEHRGKNRKPQSIKILGQHKLGIANEQGTKEQSFQFDRVFEPSCGQIEVAEEVQQLVISCLDGFNVCIMAYGQTGSGKTHTMIGDDDNPGLYFTSIDQLFQGLQERKKVIEYEVGVSIVEIYNETLRDLLAKKNPLSAQVKLRDNGDGETVTNQIVKPVHSKNQIMQYLQQACMNRTVGVTHYNDQSSRSHLILTVYVTGKHRETKEVFRGRLNLIDLAGSERILKSQAEGERVKEALNINQSLTTLGKVFLALLNKTSHVPYRDSKLTHYLKDSLGGESKTMLVLQVSPNMNDYSETISSLNFGQRVACIEKGVVKATIESPRSRAKRSRSQRGEKGVEYELMNRSVTPQNNRDNYNSFYN